MINLKYILVSLLVFSIFSPVYSVSALSSYQTSLFSSGNYWYDSVSPLDCETTDGPVLAPGNVYILGDSITDGAEDSLRSKFTTPWNVGEKDDPESDLINGLISRPVTAAVGIIEEDSSKIASANAIVIALGTNNYGSDISSHIKETIAAIRGKTSAPIFWVDTGTTNTGKWDLEPVNKSIHDNSAALDYTVLSWFQTLFPGKNPTEIPDNLEDNLGFLNNDELHPSGAGVEAFSSLIFDGVSRSMTQTATGTSAVAVGESNVEIVYNTLRSRGLTAEQAAGVTGNLMAESGSGIDPSVVNSSSQAYGIAQWLGGRKTNLQNFAEFVKMPIDSLEMQLNYLWMEITFEYLDSQGNAVDFSNSNPKVDPRIEAWIDTYGRLTATTTVIDATHAWADNFERSGDKAAIKRIAYAIAVFANFGDNPVVGSVFATDPSCQVDASGLSSINIIPGDTEHIPCKGEVVHEYNEDGYARGEHVRIHLCVIKLPDGGAGPVVNSQISGPVYEMIRAGARDGKNLSGSAYRTNETQMQLRVNNCSGVTSLSDSAMDDKDAVCETPTARPGYSNHQMGLAIDMHDIPVSCPVKVNRDGHDNYCTAPDNPVWVWLDSNAGSYGLKQFYKETWHWSVDGG